MGGNSLIDRLFKRESTTKEEIRQLVDEDRPKENWKRLSGR